MKDYPIGSVFNYENVQLKVVAQKENAASCVGCCFTENRYTKWHGGRISCYVHGLCCTKHIRKDKKHVIFVINN